MASQSPLGVGVDDAPVTLPRLDLCPEEDKKVQSALPLKAPAQEECHVHEDDDDDDDDEHFFRSIAEEPDENMENFHEGGETKQTTNNKQQHTPPPPPPQTSPRRKNSTNNNSTNSNGASTSSGSNYRGVTAHRMSGRWESHVSENGRQVYLGTFESEEHAARAHDRMAIHLKMHQQTVSSTSDHDASEDAGVNDLANNTDVPALNFPIADYADELHSLRSSTREDLVARLRRESSGFSRGTSTYRGVSYRESTNRWEARIGRLLGRKYSYLGTFATGEAAARAYDRAAIVCRGRDAITNFHLSEYEEELAKVEAATPEERTEMERAIVSRTEVADALCRRKRVDGVAETAKGLAAAEPPAAAAATAATASATAVAAASTTTTVATAGAGDESPTNCGGKATEMADPASSIVNRTKHFSATIAAIPPGPLLMALSNQQNVAAGGSGAQASERGGHVVQGVMGAQKRRFKRVRSAPAPPLQSLASAIGAVKGTVATLVPTLSLPATAAAPPAVGGGASFYSVQRSVSAVHPNTSPLPTARHEPAYNMCNSAMEVNVDELRRRAAELAREQELVHRALAEQERRVFARMLDESRQKNIVDVDDIDILPDLESLLLPSPRGVAGTKRRAEKEEVEEENLPSSMEWLLDENIQT